MRLYLQNYVTVSTFDITFYFYSTELCATKLCRRTKLYLQKFMGTGKKIKVKENGKNFRFFFLLCLKFGHWKLKSKLWKALNLYVAQRCRHRHPLHHKVFQLQPLGRFFYFSTFREQTGFIYAAHRVLCNCPLSACRSSFHRKLIRNVNASLRDDQSMRGEPFDVFSSWKPLSLIHKYYIYESEKGVL